MNLIVAFKIVLFSAEFNLSSPYNSQFVRTEFVAEFKQCNLDTIGFTTDMSLSLCTLKRGQSTKKWSVVSIPVPQRQVSFGVSMNLWRFLWCLSGLSPTLSWYIYLMPVGSWMRKMLLFWGLIVFSIALLNLDNVSNLRTSGSSLFQQLITESG